jgi:hypothetical protein
LFSRFTASARRVMQRAFREAKRWQHDFVGTEHLLYGLLCDADGPAVSLLRSLDAKPELMLQKVELSLQQHDGGQAMEQFPLSPASKRVFRAALEEAERFHHQLIGSEHLLLGLLREHDAEAAQVLAAHGLTLAAVWAAVAELAPDRFHEAQIQSNDQRAAPGDNPSADELERWIAPAITVETETADLNVVGRPHAEPSLLQQVESQLRVTQIVLGGFVGYAFGHWLAGWMMGSVMALAGIGIASFRSSWVGLLFGAACGLFITPIFHTEMAGSPAPVLHGLVGAFLGSFLGDGWRFTRATPAEPPAPEASSSEAPDSGMTEKPAAEKRESQNVRSES